MRQKIVLLLLLSALSACGGSGNRAEKETVDTRDTVLVTLTDPDTTKTDAVSSATSKPNEILFNGTMIVPPDCQATVTVIMGGTVKNSSLLSGTAVRKGQVLATLENPAFIDLQQSYLDSRAQLEYLEAEYKRQQTLAKEQAASQKKLQQSRADYLSMKSKEQAAAAQLQLLGIDPVRIEESGRRPYLEVKSPIDGYVGNVRINPGKHIAAGEPVCDVINKDRTLLRLVAYEKDLAHIQKGAVVEFTVNGIGNQAFI